MSEEVINYLNDQYPAALERLKALLSIPSVSADSTHKPDVERAARWLADQLAQAGLDAVEVIPTERNPVVYAEWLHAPGQPTVLLYGHYDVQPPDPLEKWLTPPFEPTVHLGRLYARGASDDKGPTMTVIEVVRAFLEIEGKLPVNVKFLLEGEEEIGSPSIEPFMEANKQKLACDFVVSGDGAMWRTSEPSLIVASRGSTSLEFSVFGAGKDLHSGRHGGAVANPLQAMSHLLASLHTADGRIAVAGFYDDVVELSQEERDAIRAIDFDEQAYLDEVGAPAGFGEPGYSLLERNWTRPTLEIIGMWGGYQGEGIKTVLPAEAHAKISCRLVPDQDPADIVAKIERHLLANQPPGVKIVIRKPEPGSAANRIPADHPGMVKAAEVLRELYGQEPLMVRIGATLPISDAFRTYLGVDTIMFAFSTVDEDYHAPNEFFRLRRFKDGMRAWVMYLNALQDIRFQKG